MRRTIIAWLLLGLCCVPAQAIVQPRLYDWQARLTRLLPVSIKDKAVNLSEELFEESANIELLHNKVLQLNAPIPHEPIELFIGIKLLIKNDAVLNNEKAKEAEYDKALDLLKKYKHNLKRHLYSAPYGPDTSSAELKAPQRFQGHSQEDERGIFVLRLLPAPSPSHSKATLHSFIAACSEDEEAMKKYKQDFNAQLVVFKENNRNLRRYINDLSEQLSPVTGLPLPKSPKNLDNDKIEQIPPPPPIDLQPIKEK
ncbi:MAG: hypothetical protein K6G50_14080 [bacterium]|nr:hypothetical protein [bacterium]